MAKFLIAFKKTLSHEGGYVNDPQDRGGETYNGIARRFHPKWEGWMIIDNEKKKKTLNRGDVIRNGALNILVQRFYKEKFWNACKLDKVQSQNIANEIFDTAVNMHTYTAAWFVQESLNILNRGEKDYKDIAVDGKIGNQTLNTLNKYPHETALLKCMNGLQFMRYFDICKHDPTQERFMRGWLNRV